MKTHFLIKFDGKLIKKKYFDEKDNLMKKNFFIKNFFWTKKIDLLAEIFEI